MKLNNGAIPLSFLFDEDRQSGFVLARWRDEFVVWSIEPGNNGFFCTNGHYYSKKADARKLFQEKVSLFYERIRQRV